MPDIFSYLYIILLLILSAFFSSSEIAFASVTSLRLKSLKENKDTFSVRLANKIKDKYDDSLSAILIGNTFVNNASSSIATVIVIYYLGEEYAFVATVIMTLLVLTFGEIVPKVLAKQFSEKFSVAVALPVYIVTMIFKPITFIVMGFVNLVSKLWSNSTTDTDTVSEDDLENIIDIVEDEGVLDEEQCDLLQNALEFDEVPAYQVVTHRVDMVALDIKDAYEVNLQKIFESDYTRLPVYEDTPDNIIGILHLNNFYKEYVSNDKISIRKLLMPVTFVHQTMSLSDVLNKMKEVKCHMVVVLDEYGGTYGILTMEDVLEQLVGEIFDETDDIEPEFVCIDDTHFSAEGDMRIYDFFDEFDIDIEDDDEFVGDISTVGGFVTEMLDGEVENGAEFEYKNLKFSVTDCDEKRVEKIGVEIIPEEKTDGEDE